LAPELALREVASCERPPGAFALAPTDLVVDDAGFLIVSTSENSGRCALSGLASLAGRIYRVDPSSGAAALLYESEIVHDGAAFLALRLVPADHPFDDRDGDGLADVLDKCPLHADPAQQDLDGDGIGDACNDADDRDGDEFADARDRCPDTADVLQLDADGDGQGDACDAFPSDPNNEAAALRVSLSQSQAELQACRAELHLDADGDAVEDAGDACPATAAGVTVDSSGCSLGQFCSSFAITRRTARGADCVLADWRNDEVGRVPLDCRPRGGRCIAR
jgi:hypothetical protein